MKKINSNLLAGLFVITGFIMFLGLLFVFGLKSAFQKKFTLYTVFSESVQGLDVGSPVKYKGVAIGNVGNIKILPKSSEIYVTLEINSDSLLDPDKTLPENQLELDIKRGLFCQLQGNLLTGLKYVELNRDFGRLNIRKLPPQADNLSLQDYVPSAPSAFDDIFQKFSQMLTKTADIDFTSMINNVSELANIISTQVKKAEFSKTFQNLNLSIEELYKVLIVVNENIVKMELPGVSHQVVLTLKSIENSSNVLKEKIEELNLTDLNADVQKFVRSGSALTEKISKNFDISGESLEAALNQLNSSFKSIQDLVEMLENDPSVILHGKNKSE